jgi:L-arabinokinase
VARHARHRPEDTRSALGLPLGLPLVLLSFGGYGLEGFSVKGLDLTGYGVVTTSQVGVRLQRNRGQAPVLTIDEATMYRAGFKYEDLVAACDAVVSKPGYGIIAECAANGAALLYTSRGRFAEYDVLVSSMPDVVRSRFIPQNDLFAGRWQLHLDALLSQPPPATRPATNGAEVVARRILDMIG